jgi:hypothetical protein
VAIEQTPAFPYSDKFRQYSEISLAFEYFHVLMSVDDAVAPSKPVAADEIAQLD